MYILTAPMMCCADINIISISSCFILEWLNFGKKMMNHQDWSCTRSRRICGRRILPVPTTMLRTCATTSPSACASVAAAVTTTSTKATSAPSFSSTATASSILHFLKLLIYPILIPSFFFCVYWRCSQMKIVNSFEIEWKWRSLMLQRSAKLKWINWY